METLLALYAFGGILLAGLSVPLVLHRIPPNGVYGLRVRKGGENTLLWYKVNAYAGRRFLAAGLGTAFGSIVLFYTSPESLESYALSCLGLLLALFLWASITSFLYLQNFKEE